jgi:hypothetical protein
LLELAAPIAQSMGALHQIEKSGGTQLQPHADTALNNVRHALQALQQHPPSHPAVAAAMEAVAASLGLVHNLARMAQGGPAAAPPVPPPPAFIQQPPQQPAAAFAPTQMASSPAAFVPQQAPPPPAYQPPPQAPQAPPRQAPPPAAGGDGQIINADLGTHSPTNFYKGLSGNDIIDHGGLFVSTYMVPKIGTPVRLKVSLPGGYEFEANAIVAWSREASDAGYDAPPGFGAKFTQITQEARQLVYRYVRNREPLFHDDL